MPSGKAGYSLTKEQRDLIANRLLHPTNQTARLTFDQMRKIRGISVYDNFNTESEKRPYLTGDETAARMRHEDRWGPTWFDLDLTTQDEIVGHLIDEEEKDKLIAYLCDIHGSTKERAYGVADCPLVAGYGSLSKPALDKILPHLVSEVIVYSEAATREFGDHRPQGDGVIYDEKLPYYGIILDRHVAFGTGNPKDSDEKRYGKVANPTVHVALNQVRAVVNDLLNRFGPPAEIVIELARDLPLSARGKGELETRQRQNQEANERRRKQLEDEFKQRDNYENRMRLRLYEDLEALGKRCVYTGEHIGAHNLFSDEVEIDHILPFSRTFDDSYSNKILVMRRANRDKGNQTPHECFGNSPSGYDWAEIAKRAAELPPNKRWRFGPDAMERYDHEEDGFIARQLTDTQYIARLAKGYLEVIYPDGSASNVWTVTGRLTSDLRWQWGLDSVLRGHNDTAAQAQKKNRDDHRHHAIDAIVIACTDRAMLQRAAKQARKNEHNFDDRLMAGIEEPWPDFRSDVEKSIRAIIVSHKPDHGIQGAMHNDTTYGIPKGEKGMPDKKGVRTVVTRKPLDGDAFRTAKDFEKIRDDQIRQVFKDATYGLSGTDFKEALLITARGMVPKVNKIRIEENLRVIPFKDRAGKEYKAYKGSANYCYDIWKNEKDKWIGEVISTYDAYQLSREDPDWWVNMTGRQGQNLTMRIRKNDLLKIEHEGKSIIVQVYKFSAGKINMTEHFEANGPARISEKSLQTIQKPPGSLQKSGAKRITVSPSGVVKIYH